jgi:hypothetical protein
MRLRFHVVSLSRAIACAAMLLLPALATAAPCVVPNTGGGTVQMPPPGCGYVSPNDFHMIIDGLPPGTTIQVGVEHQRFVNVTHTPGGPLGGETEEFGSQLKLHMKGTGLLASFSRDITLDAQCRSHTGPRVLGDPVQAFPAEMARILGQLPPGDPDFDVLRITAGSDFGLPSPGQTVLTLGPGGGRWNVDSFFDITYRIDFVGAPGGPLGGMSGSTTGTIRMQNGEPVPPPLPPCTVADDGSGTVQLPPQGCGYVSPDDLHRMIDGLPPGTTIEIGAEHRDFFLTQHGPGGSLGGEFEQFGSVLMMRMQGTGDLGGFQRLIPMQVQCETHTAPRTPGQNIQSFDTDMFRLQGQIAGDPDFDLLRITAGTGFGLPSPGHTTLTKGPPGTFGWNVDSFFDITYRIDFVGAPGGPLGGMSGSTTGTIRMQTGAPTLVGISGRPQNTDLELTSQPNPFVDGATMRYRLATAARVQLRVYDVSGSLVRTLTDDRLPAGPHAMLWDGRTDAGQRVAPGNYFVRLAIDGRQVASKKAVLLK